jgi:deoxyxylulose-5-phosphate synthase
VYQIWDSNRGSKPTYKFKNQRELIEKKFGIKKYYSKYIGGFKEWIEKLFDEKTLQQFNDKKNKFNKGDAFKIKDKNEFLIYIGNNHKWFYVDEELFNFFQKLRGKKVILVGGSNLECIMDIYVSAKSFNITPIYNHQYIYSAETGNQELKNKS